MKHLNNELLSSVIFIIGLIVALFLVLGFLQGVDKRRSEIKKYDARIMRLEQYISHHKEMMILCE